MLAAFNATLIKITAPNEKGYVDVSVLPDGSDYVERLWVKAGEPAGQQAVALFPSQAQRPAVRVVADLRASITKGEHPRAYLNGRVDQLEPLAAVRPVGKTQAA